MANITRFVTYELPERTTYNQINLYESTSENGYYALSTTSAWVYGTCATEFTLDDGKWYKVRFTDGSISSPYSNAFFGGEYEERGLFSSVGSSFDGAYFASVSGFFNTTNLNTTFVPVADVRQYLRIARAYIDLQMGDVSPYKYAKDWGPGVTRRKYNAQIEMIKTAEIYFSAALAYQDLSDDRVQMGLSGVTSPVDLPTSITTPDVITISGEIAPEDLTTPGDLTIDDIYSSGNIVIASGGANSFSIGQTSISSSVSDSVLEMEAAKYQLEKTLGVAQHNNAKNIAIAEYNYNKELDYARYNAETTIKAAETNVKNRIDVERWNLEKSLQVAEYFNKLQVDRYIKEAEFYSTLSQRYAVQAANIINTFKPTYTPIRYNEFSLNRRFVAPGDIYSFAITDISTVITDTTVDYVVADSTGLGDDFSGASFLLDAANMTTNAVDGEFGQNVLPLQNASTIIECVLTVNGVEYYLDKWVDGSSNTQAGRNGSSDGTSGFSIDFSINSNAIRMEWLYTSANGGFDLTATDTISFSYVTVA